jgi:hypothetical protein
MTTKTDRILSYLPGTFRALLPVSGAPSALYAVADTFGGELQQAENRLAEIMRAHWVDTADRGAPAVDDLAHIAALYGLLPRDDETVEQFREHLLRYVRTFLEGTVTVQGVLRVAAEALGLRIADGYGELDTWWKRSDDALVSTRPDTRDAASSVFGFAFGRAEGRPARPAQLKGAVDLRAGADLRGTPALMLQVDELETQSLALLQPGDDAAHVPLAVVVERLNAAFRPLLGRDVAFVEDERLVVRSPTTGPSSRLEFEEAEGDAATRLLGLRPLAYFGSAAVPARLLGSVDLSGDLDLRAERYLRLMLDGALTAEIDVGGATPGHRTVEEVRDAIAAELGPIASIVEGEGKKLLVLTSPTSGAASSIAVQAAAAQDAARRLFGDPAPVYLGADERPATITSPELEREVDLSLRYNLRLSVDDGVALTVNCAGLRPSSTTLDEIANALNAALGTGVARRVDRRLVLTSPSAGAGSQLRFETPDDADATELLFGLPPRTRRGTAASSARLVGKVELDELNLMARSLLSVRLDGGPKVTVDLRRGVTRAGFTPDRAILADLVESLEAALGPDTASDDGLHLVLSSPTLGGGSSVELASLEIEERRRFVSRAVITGEASGALFGFEWRSATGTAATNARLTGKVDLSHGVDLRAARYLRLGLDGRDAVDIDCSGPRPRATLLDEAVAKINGTARAAYLLETDVAFSDGKRLVLASPSVGAGSALRFEAPRAADALDELLGVAPGVTFGVAATGVAVLGVPDLGAGVELPANAAMRVALDGGAPVEIPLTGDTPKRVTLNDLLVAISVHLGSGVANHDGRRLRLTSRLKGSASNVAFEVPAGADATFALFGFLPPRSYRGADARPAELTGAIELSTPRDLRVRRFLRIGVDGKAPLDIDCARTSPAAAPGEPDPAASTELQHVIAKVNAALKADVAIARDGKLHLVSPSAGIDSRLTLERHSGGDARAALLGAVPDVTLGSDPEPAEIVADVARVQAVDLLERGMLRLAVDGGRPRDIDVRGPTPALTFLDDAVAKINDVFPGVASITSDDKLRLVSPTAGESSSLAVLPLRTLDLLEYPPEAREPVRRRVRHGTSFAVLNQGALAVEASIEIVAPAGAIGPALLNEATGLRLELHANLRPGESARLRRSARGGVEATIVSASGAARALEAAAVKVGPLGPHAQVPLARPWPLTGGSTGRAHLLLDDAFAPSTVELVSLKTGPDQPELEVIVSEASPQPAPAHAGDGGHARFVGRLRYSASGPALEGPAGAVLARVRNALAEGIAPYAGLVVAASGPLFAAEIDGEAPLLIAERVERLFDVTLSARLPDGTLASETYDHVTLGGEPGAESLAWQLNSGPRASRFARARALDKASVLELPRGRSRLRYLSCASARFDEAFFDEALFAGGVCHDRGIFDVSRFDNSPPESSRPVFASRATVTDPEVELALAWVEHRPGAFELILPADLPDRFGGRFNQARFGRRSAKPETYARAVTEPLSDERHVVTLVNAESALVRASVVPRVPLGWSAVAMPFRQPLFLTLGSEESPARIYLSEEGLAGFLEIRAKSEGAWGNGISVAARKAGPALFDVTIAFEGAVFEVARAIAAGGADLDTSDPTLPELVTSVLEPGPVGVLLAKAAGVRSRVTREGLK